MKKTSFLAGALLALAPVMALTVPGCGGGNGGIFPNPTATSTATSTPTSAGTATPTSKGTATPTPAATQVSNLTLGNGQRAILTSNVTDTSIKGSIEILAATTATKTRAISFNFTAGKYPFTGTITAAGAFTINGNLGSFGAFKMSGKLPTATTPGSYTLTVNGQTETGVIPVPGKPFPTPVPTSGGSNYKLTSNLTFANVSSGSDIVKTPITSYTDLTDGGKLTNLSLNGAKYQTVALSGVDGPQTGNGTRRTLGLVLNSFVGITNLKPFSVGQTISLGLGGGQAQLSQTVVQGTSVKIGAWRASSGMATVKAIGANSITVDIDLHFEPTPILGGTGSFDLKGTVTGTGLTVANVNN